MCNRLIEINPVELTHLAVKQDKPYLYEHLREIFKKEKQEEKKGEIIMLQECMYLCFWWDDELIDEEHPSGKCRFHDDGPEPPEWCPKNYKKEV